MQNSIELDQLLVSYSVGSLSHGEAMLVATHLALSPESRARLADFEIVHGVLADAAEQRTIGAQDRIGDILTELDRPTKNGGSEITDPVSDAKDIRIPKPLSIYLDRKLEELGWRFKFPGVREYTLGDGPDGQRVSLLRIEENAAIPSHTHNGNELTLVLSGGFSDASGHFGPGDVCIADPTVDHRPVADSGQPCFCLAVTEGPVRLTGPYGRILEKFTGR